MPPDVDKMRTTNIFPCKELKKHLCGPSERVFLNIQVSKKHLCRRSSPPCKSPGLGNNTKTFPFKSRGKNTCPSLVCLSFISIFQKDWLVLVTCFSYHKVDEFQKIVSNHRWSLDWHSMRVVICVISVSPSSGPVWADRAYLVNAHGNSAWMIQRQ